MPRFAANLTMLFQEHDFLDRFGEAARAGFRGVEFLFPYEHRTAAIAERLACHDLSLVLHNLPAGDWAAGERGIAVLPERRPEFREGVARAIDAAGALGCGQVNCLAGIAPSGLGRDRLRDTLRENLAYAAAALKRAGIRLLIEPVNTRDIPGFFLTGTAQAVALIDEVGSDNLFLQYDAYHMQIMEGDLARTIEANLPRIAHVQLADNPGRHEPGTGEINYPFLFGHLDALGYRGWIGCEYRPASGTRDGLSWFAPHRA
ncbi:hydroxypyruvate isomerase [Methylobacterium goesingense]|uniref:Hydroxypyruvate isomerase n=1 Tax=Methylobacterium goesingense TaxID=243690 RepID=A0ABV2L8B3_9HYPH|nr:hydroxypyruvate isomerase [Methylobacterium goesingense]GJD75815.1 Hydroxypyruvate isomerase [Methylobacterium goesingense]